MERFYNKRKLAMCLLFLFFLAAIPVFASEFEGQYKVGNTTCFVKPIKMAFEVTWAKGIGSMIFFFDYRTPEGKLIFVSEDEGKGEDKFIFDNDNYDSGKFIRADGKEFGVKKIK